MNYLRALPQIKFIKWREKKVKTQFEMILLKINY